MTLYTALIVDLCSLTPLSVLDALETHTHILSLPSHPLACITPPWTCYLTMSPVVIVPLAVGALRAIVTWCGDVMCRVSADMTLLALPHTPPLHLLPFFPHFPRTIPPLSHLLHFDRHSFNACWLCHWRNPACGFDLRYHATVTPRTAPHRTCLMPPLEHHPYYHARNPLFLPFLFRIARPIPFHAHVTSLAAQPGMRVQLTSTHNLRHIATHTLTAYNT